MPRASPADQEPAKLVSSTPTRHQVPSAQPTRPQPRSESAFRSRRISPFARFAAEVVAGTSVPADASRFFTAVVFALLGLCVATGAAMTDVYFHRGVETSAAPPYVVQVSGRDMATNVDLLSFTPDQVDSVASVLATNGFLMVRQPFSWAAIEPSRGAFVWEPYDRIVDALRAHSIQVVAVLAHAPDWARAASGRGAIDAPPAVFED
jgi:hypothetical protein